MNDNKQVIEKFYTSFAHLNWQGMTDCYHDDILFYDPVFQSLEGKQAKAMWEMLCKQAKDFTVTTADITTDEEGYGSCNWTATYTFSATGRKVVNQVTARFRFQDGKIIEHNDEFDLYKWSRQALGWKGLFFGWTPWLQKAIQKKAKRSLDKFMQAQKR